MQKKPSRIGERLGHKVSINPLSKHPDGYKWRATFIEGGKRRQKYFKTEASAKRWRDEREEETRESGTAHRLTTAERNAVIETREMLTELNLDVREALDHAIEYFQRSNKSATVAELVKGVIGDRRRANRSERHLADIKSKLGRFTKTFGGRSVATVTQDEIADWLHALKLKPTSTNGYRIAVVTAFSDAVKRGYISDNPASKVLAASVTEAKFSALTPGEALRLIEAADEQILPAIALGLFAGARDSELKQLNWREIDFEGDEESPHGYVRIKATVAKSARNRLIPMSENLKVILMPHAKEQGKVWPANGRKLHEAARLTAGFAAPKQVEAAKAEGIELKIWPENALRHSFASYHLAHHKNSDELALHMGHTNTRLIFKHYRKLVRPSDATTYWSIMPGQAENILSIAS